MKSYDYNKISKVYDDVRQADFKAVEFMIQKSELKEDSKILEIGCGTGNYLKIFSILFKGDFYGIDQSKGMIEKAKEKCNKVKFIVGEATKLKELKDDSFNIIYLVDVIHHIKDIELLFENIFRVLKKDGKLFIFSDSHEHIKNRLTTKYFPETLSHELKRYQDTTELINTAEKIGFSNIQSGKVEIGWDNNYGKKLIKIAAKKGYSMFGFLTDEEINSGINKIKLDMKNGINIKYHMMAPYVYAEK